jgi:DNA-binding MarR family transcriptional regulator
MASDDERLTLRLLRTARELSDALAPIVAEHDLTVDQWLSLELLVEHQSSGLSMTDLRGRTGLAGATLTRTVDRLIVDALAHREVDPSDRRRVLVHVSKSGLARYQKSKSAVDRVEQNREEFSSVS